MLRRYGNYMVKSDKFELRHAEIADYDSGWPVRKPNRLSILGLGLQIA